MRKVVVLSIIKTQSNVQVTCGLATTKSETREQNDYYATPPQGSKNVDSFGKRIVSDRQIRIQCGNSIVVQVLEAIFKEMFKDYL